MGKGLDSKVTQAGTNRRCLRWVDWQGNPVLVSSEVTATSQFKSTVLKVSCGEALGDVGDLLFRDPTILGWASYMGNPIFHQSKVLSWIEGSVCLSLFSAFLRGF